MKQKAAESNSFFQPVFPRYLLLSEEWLGYEKDGQKDAEVKGSVPKKADEGRGHDRNRLESKVSF